MKYKYVYRVETKKSGRGPFYSYAHAMNCSLPSPEFDDGLWNINLHANHRFGAPTKKMMREWIVDSATLHLHCYVVRKYKVPVDKVVSSKIQSIFYKRGSSVVEEYDIVEFKKGKKKCVN